MLIKTEFTFREPTEESIKRALAVFAAWEAPPGFEIQAFYNYSDGTGGFSVAEVADADAAARAIVPFMPWADFTMSAIVPIEAGKEIADEAIAFRDSIS